MILAQTRFMEITCLIRYDSSPASYHVTANNFKFTTSLMHFRLDIFSHMLSRLISPLSCKAMVTHPTHNLIVCKSGHGLHPVLLNSCETSARIESGT